MSDYTPLDLSPFYNVGPDVYARLGRLHGQNLTPQVQPSLGLQTLHGVPFHIGAHEPCFIGLGPGACETPVTVPLASPAHIVLVVHALLESSLDEGEPVGRIIADYGFRYADGQTPTEVAVPIRERFEIGVIPAMWGMTCLLAAPDLQDAMLPRHGGAWGNVGYRMTEARQGRPQAYYIWAWQNPYPDRPLADLVITPHDRRFIVAAITLGHVAENPLSLPPKRTVQLTLRETEDAGRPFDLRVEVDRGVASYPYPLTPVTDELLADPLRGFGQAMPNGSSPAYVEVTAVPSATLTVKSGEEELGHVRWGEVATLGQATTPRVQLEIVEDGRNWVFTTVVDDTTGQPIPCRVHFRSPRGIPYQPHGHHGHVYSNLDTWHVDVGGDVRLGETTYAYIDGRCQGWLPTGEVVVDVARGFEYEPLRTRVLIAPGQRELTLRLRRVADMNAARYFSGDTHVHFLSTQGSHTEAAGEDLNVVNLLLSQWGHLFTNTEEFTGQPSVARDGRTIVYATQENRQHMLGHMTLLGVKSPIMPWCSDGPSEAELGGNLETVMAHWADACHAQGGTVVLPHFPRPNAEPAALIATGRVDAVEMFDHRPLNHAEYYRYLNGGYRLPLVGGTDKMSSEVPVGLYRTYVHIPADQPFTYDTWLAGLRSGHTFISSGPLLRFTVDGQPIGSLLRLGWDGGTVEVEAVADSIFPIHTLQIVEQGRIVASTEDAAGTRRLSLKTRLTISGDTWLAARCAGPAYTSIAHHDVWRRGIMAHTSPVYIACGDAYTLCDPATLQYMLTLIDGSLAYLRTRTAHRPPAPITHHHGEADHAAYLERPFLEAQAIVHRRLHELGVAH